MATVIKEKSGGGSTAVWLVLGVLVVLAVIGVMLFAGGGTMTTASTGDTTRINQTTDRVTSITRDAGEAAGEAIGSTADATRDAATSVTRETTTTTQQ